MDDVASKVDGDEINGDTWKQAPQESQNIITDSGQALNPGDLRQLAKAVPIVVANKAAANLIPLIENGRKVFIASPDGGSFTMKTGQPVGTLNDNGGTLSGTRFTNGDGSSGLLRDDIGLIMGAWFQGSAQGSAPAIEMYNNAYYDSTGFKYKTDGPATKYTQGNLGDHTFYRAVPGVADADVTWIPMLAMNTAGAVRQYFNGALTTETIADGMQFSTNLDITHSGSSALITNNLGPLTLRNTVVNGNVSIQTKDALDTNQTVAVFGISGGTLARVRLFVGTIVEAETNEGLFNVVNKLQIAGVDVVVGPIDSGGPGRRALTLPN